MSRKTRTIKIDNPPPAPARPVIEAEVNFPVLSADFIKDLDAAYPPRCVQLHETMESAQRYAGKRELIDQMLSWLHEDAKVGS